MGMETHRFIGDRERRKPDESHQKADINETEVYHCKLEKRK